MFFSTTFCVDMQFLTFKLKKMKYFNYLIIAIFALLSCNKNKSEAGPLNEVNMEIVKSMLPKELFNGSKAIYKDQDGREIIIDITYTTTNSEAIHSTGHKYNREEFHVILSNTDEKILIDIDGFSQLDDSNSSIPIYMVFISNFKSSNSISGSVIVSYSIETGKIVPSSFNCILTETEIVLGETYKNVFRSNSTDDIYQNGLRFNLTEGVVSLNNLGGKLFVFDRFAN
jgi:hypothetical protein